MRTLIGSPLFKIVTNISGRRFRRIHLTHVVEDEPGTHALIIFDGSHLVTRVDPEIHAVGLSITTRYLLAIFGKNRVFVRFVVPRTPDLVGTLWHVRDCVLRAPYFRLQLRPNVIAIENQGEYVSVH